MQKHNGRIVFFGKQREFTEKASAVLQGTLTTLLPHTHPDCHFPPPPHHHLPIPRQLFSSHGAVTVHWSILHSLRLKTDDSHEFGQPLSALALLNNLGHAGYAGIRVGEAENPGPATHDRDWTVTEQPLASHRRINEAGDSVPSSQASVTR